MRPEANAMRKDNQVRELFKWIEGEDRRGVHYATIADETGNRAQTRHGLKLDGPIKLLVAKGVREFTFVDTRLVIRHDGDGWQLVVPSDLRP
jgi:hypothetical protein